MQMSRNRPPLHLRATLLGAAIAAGCSGAEGNGSSTTAPPATFDGSLRFVNEIGSLGGESISFGRGAASVDFDGDGLIDIAAANAGMPNAYFRQLEDHTFEIADELWGITPDSLAHWGMVAADYDNDGDPDLYVVNGGFGYADPNQLLQNDIDRLGILTDISASAGQAQLKGRNFAGTALDYDNDGLLDLFVTNSAPEVACSLLHNLDSMLFIDVSSDVGIDEVGMYLGCSSGDLDQDGWIDIACAQYSGPPVLYQNQGDGSFKNVAVEAGLTHEGYNFGLVLEDFNNDGDLDIFQPKYDPSAIGIPSRLYIGGGDATFTDVTDLAVFKVTTAMGHNTGDLDGDGYPDIMIGSGNPGFSDLDLLYLMGKTPQSPGASIDASDSSGLTGQGPTRSHGMAFADFDEDGDIDVYASQGGPHEDVTTIEGNAFWINQGNDSLWIKLRLEGVISNRSAIGAHAIATTSADREVHRYMRAGHGFSNTNSPILHFGIGPDEFVKSVEVRWPSGLTQVVALPAMEMQIDLVETALIEIISQGSRRFVRVCGAARHEVELLFGGNPVASGILGEDGLALIEIPWPTIPLDQSKDLSAWIHAPGKPDQGIAPVPLHMDL